MYGMMYPSPDKMMSSMNPKGGSGPGGGGIVGGPGSGLPGTNCFSGRYSPTYRVPDQMRDPMRRCMTNTPASDIFGSLNDSGLLCRASEAALVAVDMKHPVVPVSATAAAAAAAAAAGHAAAFNQIKTDMMNSYHSHHNTSAGLPPPPPPQIDSNGNTSNANRIPQVCKYEQMDHPHSVSGMSGLDMLGSHSPATEQAGSNPAASVAAALQMSAAAGGGGDPTVGSLAAAAAAHHSAMYGGSSSVVSSSSAASEAVVSSAMMQPHPPSSSIHGNNNIQHGGATSSTSSHLQHSHSTGSGAAASSNSHHTHSLHHPHSIHLNHLNPNNLSIASIQEAEADPRELEAFAERFKQRRIKLGVTQCDVGKALANLKLPGVGALSQSTICRFESLTLSHNNMIALKPVLSAWLDEAEAARRDPDLTGMNGVLPPGEKKRKRTSIAAPEKRSLEAYFAVQPRPSGEKIAAIADKLELKKNVVRVWFCNQRQKQKRMKFAAIAGGPGGPAGSGTPTSSL